MSTYYIADAIEKLAKNLKEVMDEKNRIERERLEFEKEKFKQSEQQSKECEHDWVFYESRTHTVGTDVYYKCGKCDATKLVCNGVTYESVEWQP